MISWLIYCNMWYMARLCRCRDMTTLTWPHHTPRGKRCLVSNSDQSFVTAIRSPQFMTHTIHVWYTVYLIFTCIYHQNQPSVGKYVIHRSYGWRRSSGWYVSFVFNCRGGRSEPVLWREVLSSRAKGSASKDAYHIECATYFINIFLPGMAIRICLFICCFQ